MKGKYHIELQAFSGWKDELYLDAPLWVTDRTGKQRQLTLCEGDKIMVLEEPEED